MMPRASGPVGARSILWLGLGVLSASACAPLQLPYQNGGPAAREGVELSVSRQSCTQNVDPDFYGADLIDEVVEVQVRNATSSALTVQRDDFRLIAPDGRQLRAMTWRAAEPVALNAGETRTLELRYMTRGGLECTREMRLDADGGVRVNGRAIQVGAVSFQPSRAL